MYRVAAITFGRFNPPSIGHLKLVETLCNQHADAHLLFASHSQDPKKNPLSYEQKIKYLKALFQSAFPNLEVVDSPARTIIEVLQQLTGKYDAIIIVVGSDRLESFKTLIEKYNGVPDKSGMIPYSFSDITFVSAGNRDPDSDDEIEGISASKLRKFALEGDYEKFSTGIPGTNSALKAALYKDVREGMKITEAMLRKILEDKAAKEQRKKDNEQLDALMPKYFPNIDVRSKEAVALRQEYWALKKENKDLTPVDFYNLKTAEQEVDKKADQEFQASFKKAAAFFSQTAGSLPSDGGLSKIDIPRGSKARVLFTRGEPPTKLHSKAITTFLGTVTPGVYNIIAVVEAAQDSKIKNDAAIRAMWVRDLAIPAGSQVIILYGTAEAIVKTIATYFASLSFTAQPELLRKLQNLVLRTWTTVAQSSTRTSTVANYPQAQQSPQNQKQAPQTVIGKATPFLFAPAQSIDQPNIAVEGLLKVATTAKKVKTTRVANTIKASVENRKLIIDTALKEKQEAFISQLAYTGPKASDENYKIQVFYAFLEYYKAKTNTNLLDLKKLITSLFASEIEGLKDIGSQMGITQVIDAAKTIKQSIANKEQRKKDEEE